MRTHRDVASEGSLTETFRRVHGVLAACLLSILSPCTAYAEAHRTSLTWTRGEGAQACIDEAELQRVVEVRLGRAVFSADAPLLVRGEITRISGRFHVQVELIYEGQRIGLRELESERARCRSLDDSLAVIVALLVEASDDMIADAAPAVVADAPAAPSEPATVELHVPEEPVASPPAASLPFVVSMGLGAWGAMDVLPRPALGVYGFAEFTFQPWSLRAEGAYAMDEAISLAANRAALLGFAWGGLALCLDTPVVSFWEVGSCIHGRAGALSGMGTGFDESSRGSIAWLAASVSGRTRLRVAGPLAVELDVGVDVPLSRQRFVAELGGTTQVLHELPVIAPFAVLQLLLVAE